MKLPLILTSTLTDDSYTSVLTNKTCLFCGWKYFYRPNHSREYRGAIMTRYKIQDREVTKRSLQSGERNDPVDVVLFDKSLVLLTHSGRSGQGRRWNSRVYRELHHDQNWWCQGYHTVTQVIPHLFQYQTHPKTREVHSFISPPQWYEWSPDGGFSHRVQEMWHECLDQNHRTWLFIMKR